MCYLLMCYFDLIDQILGKLDAKLREFKPGFINEIKDQIKIEVSESIGVGITRKELESIVAELQQHIVPVHRNEDKNLL